MLSCLGEAIFPASHELLPERDLTVGNPRGPHVSSKWVGYVYIHGHKTIPMREAFWHPGAYAPGMLFEI